MTSVNVYLVAFEMVFISKLEVAFVKPIAVNSQGY